MRLLGSGMLLTKSDIKHTYRQIPVHLEDRVLLGMHWQSQFHVNATLRFGLQSALLIFSAIEDALKCVVRQSGTHHIFHYIDDFILLRPPGSEECSFRLQACAHLGFVQATECLLLQSQSSTLNLTHRR